MLLPDVIIAGAPKCGTTSLFDYLVDHPQVCGSSAKETCFLIDRGYPLYQEGASYHSTGLEGYGKYFSACTRRNAGLKLEATPDYLYQETPLRVLPGFDVIPRILIVLRRPEQRVYSLYRFAQNNTGALDPRVGFEQFLDMVRSDAPELAGKTILRNALEHSRYHRYIKRWADALGSGNVHVYLFEHMVSSPVQTLSEICNLLGISPGYFSDYDFSPRNRTVAVGNRQLHRLRKSLRNLPLPGFLRRAAGKGYRLMNQGELKGPTDYEKRLIKELSLSFSDDNRRLHELTGLDLSCWR